MRDVLFISHAAPEDNDFTRWLSLQLIGLGYKVWSDVIKLKGGDDWWPIIEKEIRDNSVKFILVLSKAGNEKDGVLKELAVAQKVKRQLNNPRFIVPLHIDEKLSYDDINIELIRLNSINFKKSWAEGLKLLLDELEEQQIPKSAENFDEVNKFWQTNFLDNKHPISTPEVYFSNWFPIVELPPILRFHKFKSFLPKDFKVDTLYYPAVMYKDHLVTFAWCYDFMEKLPSTEKYIQTDTYEIKTEDILNNSFNNRFITNSQAKKLIVQLLNKGFDKELERRPVSPYEMSDKKSFWLKKGVLEKDKYNRIQLVGKQKEKQWHFGISGSVKFFPENCFVINTHIWFTSDGINLIPEASKQHAARRKQGKNWWNNDWRSKTLAFMEYLAEEDKTIHIELGSEELAKISASPIMFKSPISYLDPNSENLPEEVDTFDPEDGEEINIEEEAVN